MRTLHGRGERNFIRLALAETEEHNFPVRKYYARPCQKYAVALAGSFVLIAVVLAGLLHRGTAQLAEGAAISKAVNHTVLALSCRVVNDLKVNCGHYGIKEQACRQKGCCYQPSKHPGIPWCFVSEENMKGMGEECVVRRQDKVECGFRGINKTQCEARGCCYANAGAVRVPWCYQKASKAAPKPEKPAPEQCAVPGREKVECGFEGITGPQCIGKGCCFAHLDDGTPDCFKAWKLVTGEEAEEASECGAMEQDRLQCGFKDISSEQCRDRGCCYERTGHSGVPFCFQRASGLYQSGDLAIEQKCAVPDSERFDCGFQGVTAKECRAKGCCYQQPEKSGAAPYCYYQVQTESGPPMRPWVNTASFRITMMVLLGVAAVAFCISVSLFCVGRHCYGASPAAPRCTRLDPSDELYQSILGRYDEHWKTTVWPTCREDVPAPKVKEIYELECPAQAMVYDAKQVEFEDEGLSGNDATGPGNEKTFYFGARMKCMFRGRPCADDGCTVCRVIEQGHFGSGALGSRSPREDPLMGCYRGGMRFAQWAHTAKGQGLSPGKRPPPLDMSDFVSGGAGNAVFVADVLLGQSEVLSKPADKPLQASFHSRIADISATGVDEVVIYDRAQAMPRALLIFEETARDNSR